MKHTLKLITIGITALLLVTLCITPAAAADGAAVNATNSTAGDIPYSMSEQYQKDTEAWYNYYKSLQDISIIKNLRTKIYNHLMDSSLSWEAKQNLIKPLMGWDYRLETYMDATKRAINEETGAITYDLGAGNWWAKLFGNGIEERLLPQTQAEGDALYKIYCENFDAYVNALHDAGDP